MATDPVRTAPDDTEIVLPGGTANRGQVHRVGDTVRRPLRPTTPAVHALLAHLHVVGFDGAPRPLGVDGRGREVLSYVEGEAVTAPASAWGLSDAALGSVGRLLRRFHEATAGFDVSAHSWPHAAPPPFDATAGGAVAMVHNDPNLDNVVFRAGRAVALIDFDLAGPGQPLWDVAAAARLWAPLRDPVDVTDRRRGRELPRLRLLADAYGLRADDRARLADAVPAAHDWIVGVVRDGATDGSSPGFAAYWTPQTAARAARTRRWLADNAAAITAAL